MESTTAAMAANGVRSSWIAPSNAGFKGIHLNNTLSGCKVPFFTSDGSNRVTWYICGPTVYDSSHIGHARNYVTFDIIRRILEDFFGYRVFYVMNVTDVDDKIINRARRDHLLANYRKNATNPSEVFSYLSKAFDQEITKQKSKVKLAEEELANAKTSQKKELEDKIKQEELKLVKLQQAKDEVNKIQGKAVLAGENGVSELLGIENAADVLASQLDSEHGSKVTDHDIFRKHASKYEKEFFEDMEKLGVKPPDVITRVTEYVDKIIKYVEVIVANGYAYEANGSVYFDTTAFNSKHNYGKLNPAAVGLLGLASESEANFETSDKKNNCDFALWKASKIGEPSWDSPWGPGRPGWHIECSAMASDIIGETIDIHSGGFDLKFPHHDNELAQAEAYHGCSQWVNYFLHSGHLSVDGLKMSKSLKNFTTIRQALEHKSYTASQLRLLFLLHQWDKPMDFSEAAMKEAERKLKDFDNIFTLFKDKVTQYMKRSVLSNGRPGDNGNQLKMLLSKTEIEVKEHLQDNFNTAKAIKCLSELVTGAHAYLNSEKDEPLSLVLLYDVDTYLKQTLQIFGLYAETKVAYSKEDKSIKDLLMEALATFRSRVREAGKGNEKLMNLCDELRDNVLVDIGVRLQDKTAIQEGEKDYLCEFVDPSILRKERDEKIKALADAKLKKCQTKKASKVKELEKLDAASLPPSEYFRRLDKYSQFDVDGIPTHSADGTELTKGARKDVCKTYNKLMNEHAKLQEKLKQDPNMLENIRKEVEELDKEIRSLQMS